MLTVMGCISNITDFLKLQYIYHNYITLLMDYIFITSTELNSQGALYRTMRQETLQSKWQLPAVEKCWHWYQN